jgi:hypothetical protein
MFLKMVDVDTGAYGRIGAYFGEAGKEEITIIKVKIRQNTTCHKTIQWNKTHSDYTERCEIFRGRAIRLE